MVFIRHAITTLCALLMLGAAASGEPYPSRTIKIVIPFPPGGALDITGRLLAEQLRKELKAPIIVENKTGAGGTIGANAVAKAPADGYTLLLSGTATQAFAPALFKDLPYDPISDFVPITQVTEGDLALAVATSSNIKDVPGFVAAMKAKGDAGNYASNGNGTPPHLAMELLKQKTDLQITHIPFRGGSEAVIAVLGGQVDATFNHFPVVRSQAATGKLRVLATSGNARSRSMPDIPTLKEAGHDVTASVWFGLFAPANTPREIVDQISAAVSRAVKDEGLVEKLRAQGDEIRVEGPDKLLALQKSEIEKWTPIIRKTGIGAN